MSFNKNGTFYGLGRFLISLYDRLIVFKDEGKLGEYINGDIPYEVILARFVDILYDHGETSQEAQDMRIEYAQDKRVIELMDAAVRMKAMFKEQASQEKKDTQLEK